MTWPSILRHFQGYLFYILQRKLMEEINLFNLSFRNAKDCVFEQLISALTQEINEMKLAFINVAK